MAWFVRSKVAKSKVFPVSYSCVLRFCYQKVFDFYTTTLKPCNRTVNVHDIYDRRRMQLSHYNTAGFHDAKLSLSERYEEDTHG